MVNFNFTDVRLDYSIEAGFEIVRSVLDGFFFGFFALRKCRKIKLR